MNLKELLGNKATVEAIVEFVKRTKRFEEVNWRIQRIMEYKEYRKWQREIEYKENV